MSYRSLMCAALAAAVLAPALARADSPLIIWHQGRLLDLSDAPVTAQTDITFTLYSTKNENGAGWTATVSVTPDRAGVYTVALGDSSVGPVLTAADVAGNKWLGLKVGQTPLLPRLLLGIVPRSLEATHAVEADHALNADKALNADHALNADKATNADHATAADKATLADTASNLLCTGCVKPEALSFDPKPADGSVTTTKLGDAAVTTAKLAGNSVTSNILGDASVIAGKLGPGAVAGTNLADSAVSSAKIADGAVTTVNLADGSVTTAKVADGAITRAKLAANALPTGASRALFHFDEGSGTSVADLSNNGNTMQVPGSGLSWINDGHTGKAIQYLGSGGMLQAASSDSLNITESVTLEAWVYPLTTVALGPVVGKAGQYLLGVNGNQVQCALFTVQRATWEWNGDGYVPNNAWSHVACTYDGFAIRTYVNHFLTSVTAYPFGRLATTNAALTIGGRTDTGNEWFIGKIDEVQVSATAKTYEAPGLMGAYVVVGGTSGEIVSDNGAAWHPYPGWPDLNYVKKSQSSVLQVDFDDTIRSDYVATPAYGYTKVEVVDNGNPLPTPCVAAQHENNPAAADFHLPTHFTCFLPDQAAGPHKYNLRYFHAGFGQAYFGWERSQRTLKVQELFKTQ